VTVNVGVIEGGTRSNVVAAQGKAEVDVRVLNHKQARKLDESIRLVSPKNENVELHVEGGFRRPPMERSERNRDLWKTVKSAGKELGLELEHGRSGGGSDGNTTSEHTATIDGMGAVGDGAHEEHEYIEINDVLDRTALLGLVLTMD
jgi:glutamate carboxypeptidase